MLNSQNKVVSEKHLAQRATEQAYLDRLNRFLDDARAQYGVAWCNDTTCKEYRKLLELKIKL